MPEQRSTLENEIRRLVEVAGPMPVAEFMRLCLSHPRHGYYSSDRDPIGTSGDFITAPEISQMFGELIGLWIASVWQQMGSPKQVRIVELGPGRGTLLLDALRAARVVAGLRRAVALHLVEISPPLQRLQQQRLEVLELPMLWHSALDEVPSGPAIIIANEFIDALPVHQAIKRPGGWHERVIEVESDGRLVFGLDYDPLPHFATTLPRAVRHAADGSIFEWRSDSIALELARRVRSGGAALILDYGHTQCGLGDTLQAVAGHAYADPLRTPGQVDLTAHVDFEALAQSAESMGARIHGPVLQRDFLLNLGLEKRAAALKAHVPPEKALEIDQAFARLTATGPQGMGELFKALAFSDPKLGVIPGFETAA
jgi:NADH dehydrogenase [ubiquinone] 1 alpha subcomplex assembly factor 7